LSYGNTAVSALLVSITKIGKIVNLIIQRSNDTINTLLASVLKSQPLPSYARPLENLYFPIEVTNGATSQIGLLRVDTAGVITIYATPGQGNFSFPVVIDFVTPSITYAIRAAS
jgi:hypothetical protein